MTKKKPLNLSWWLDLKILNNNSINFSYSKINNIYYLNLKENSLFFYFLLNKKNTTSLNFYITDLTTFTNKNISTYLIVYQSLYYDFKLLIETIYKKK